MKRGPYKKYKVLRKLKNGIVKEAEYVYDIRTKHSDIEHPLYDKEYYGLGEEYLVCKHFGCGKRLTLREQLFSQYCTNHQV